MNGRAIGQPSKGRRRGAVFSVRVTDEERAALQQLQQLAGGPRSLGPWLVWRALGGEPPPRGAALVLPELSAPAQVLPGRGAEVVPGPGLGSTASRTPRRGSTRAAPGQQEGYYPAGAVLPARVGSTDPEGASIDAVLPCQVVTILDPPVADRLILDLCAGSGSWSEPYLRAGYQVLRVTLPEGDVRTFVPPPGVWGVLAAPPCNEFSLAKRAPRDEIAGMETVNACMRIILQCRPRWWALENPTGHLSKYLGPPRDVWEPYHFGDPWTKRTAVWGDYQIPRRGPFVEAAGSAMDRPSAAARAVTPPGFASAFFRANP